MPSGFYKRKNAWTEEEDKILKNNYSNNTINYIKNFLPNRNEKQIKRRVFQLKLYKTPFIIKNKEIIQQLYIKQKKTDVEIAEILNVDKSTIYKIRKKLKIKAYKRIERNEFTLTEKQKQIIYGTLLGDGHISDESFRNGQSRLRNKHCPKQKEYLYWKYDNLKNLCHSAPVLTKRNQYRFSTFGHPFFTELRKKYYPNSKKCINLDILNKIGDLGLSVWCMDDGHNTGGHGFKLCTCSFSFNQHKIIKKWFKDKCDINVSIQILSGYRFICFTKSELIKLVKIIEPYLVNCMKYKGFIYESKRISQS